MLKANFLSRSYNRFKGVFKRSATLRVILTLSLIVILLPLFFQLVLKPRFEAFVESKFPDAVSIQHKLEQKFPDKKIDVTDMTLFTPHRQRILGIVVAGSNHLDINAAQDIQAITCAQLGDKAEAYDRIYLESDTGKRFLFFYTRNKKSGFLGCIPKHIPKQEKPTAQPPTMPAPSVPTQSEPLKTPTPKDGNYQPEGDMPTPKDGNFQLEGDAAVDGDEIMCCSLR
jgi:hypothetical protein